MRCHNLLKLINSCSWLPGLTGIFRLLNVFDEDLRADRQPEFTQIDVEMSFVEEKDVQDVVEGLMTLLFKELFNYELKVPFKRMTFEDAMNQYGCDKPDLRFGMQIKNLNSLLEDSGFRVFDDTIKTGGLVAGICLPGGAKYSRKQIDNLTASVKELGAKGLVAIKVKENDWDSNLKKFVEEDKRKATLQSLQANDGDLLLMVADKKEIVLHVLGELRLNLARQENMIKSDAFEILWVVDFPLFEYSEEENRYVARHHPFTSPFDQDKEMLVDKPEKVRARAYDLVLNGQEIAGGSIRIHETELQKRMFLALGISEEEANLKFGFLLEGLKYGAPPHGGIAFGFDRLVSILAGKNSIRDVIAFPKTTSAQSLMDDSPSGVSEKQLDELGLKLAKNSI